MPRLIGATQTVTTQAEQVTTFNSTGTFTAQPLSTEVQYVIVAGGGGGAFGGLNGTGGGAGGYRSSVPGESSGGGASAEPLSPVTGGSPYPVVVGAGGTASGPDGNFSTAGTSSSFNGISTVGGGGTGDRTYGNPGVQDGGSGGGGGGYYDSGGLGTANQGYPGGDGKYTDGSNNGGGAGGGAGGAGAGANPASITGNQGFTGGIGVESSITGSPVYRAGGGGSTGRFRSDNAGLGGSGGGGNGAYYSADGNGTIPAPQATPIYPSGSPGVAAQAGTANTGGGGGGCSIGDSPGTNPPGGNGGSGVVIIKELEAKGASSVWDLRSVFRNVKAGNWTN